jgi:serine/threonine protein kinase/CHASE2 domain-containing sensor protein
MADSDARARPTREFTSEILGSLASQFQFEPPLPLQIGPYQLLRRIGGGGMGTVYEAHQASLDRYVAVKLIPLRPDFPTPVAEGSVLARLRHPNIADVYDAGEVTIEGHRLGYVAMQLVPSAWTILDYCREHPLTPRQRVELFQQACDAVAHVHAQGIVHLDLKPGNILVGPDGIVKVIDFGLADGPAVRASRSGESSVGGTVEYMSPRQTRGQHPQPRDDVWSLGIILYQLLNNRLPFPFEGRSVEQRLDIIRKHPPLPARSEQPGRAVLDQIVEHALDRGEHAYYATAGELARDLRRALTGEPTSFLRGSAWSIFKHRVRSFVARQPRMTALTGIVSAVILSNLLLVPPIYDFTPGPWIDRLAHRARAASAGDFEFKFTRLVAFRDAPTLDELGQRFGIEGVNQGDLKSRRRVIAAFLDKLRGSGCKAIALDMAFTGETPHDQVLVEALRAAEVPVVAAILNWGGYFAAPELISPALRDLLILAPPTMQDPKGMGNWRLELLLDREGHPVVPSMVLATVAAAKAPGAEAFYKLDRLQKRAAILFTQKQGSVRKPAMAPLEYPLHFVVSSASADPTYGILPGDTIGEYALDLPAAGALQAQTVGIEEVLAADQATIRKMMGGRVVVLGDHREGVDGPFKVPGGQQLPGSYAVAMGIELLLANKSLPQNSLEKSIWASAIGAGLGVLITSLGWKIRTVLAVLAVSMVVAGGICWAGQMGSGGAIHPMSPTVALLVGAGWGLLTSRIRAHHVIGG